MRALIEETFLEKIVFWLVATGEDVLFNNGLISEEKYQESKEMFNAQFERSPEQQ